MMSSLWISLSLLYLLQDRVSSDEAVSLTCNKTKPVKSGETVTVNCSIKWKIPGDCKVTDCFLTRSNVTITEFGNTASTSIPVPSGSSGCILVNSTVTLKIVVEKEENITVNLASNCGLGSDDIHVDVKGVMEVQTSGTRIEEEESQSYLISSILGVLATVIVVAILSCLIRKYITSKNNQEHTIVSQEDNFTRCVISD